MIVVCFTATIFKLLNLKVFISWRDWDSNSRPLTLYYFVFFRIRKTELIFLSRSCYSTPGAPAAAIRTCISSILTGKRKKRESTISDEMPIVVGDDGRTVDFGKIISASKVILLNSFDMSLKSWAFTFQLDKRVSCFSDDIVIF